MYKLFISSKYIKKLEYIIIIFHSISKMHFILLIFLFFTLVHSYLNPQQLVYLKNMIANPNTPPEILCTSRKILIKHYYKWSLKILKNFKNKNKYALKDVMMRDMEQCAVRGLVKSVYSYNGTGRLDKYAENFVLDSILEGINHLNPGLYISKYHRSKNKNKIPKTTLVSYDNYWMFDYHRSKKNQDEKMVLCKLENKIVEKNKFVKMIQQIVDEIDPEYKRMFYYRYDRNTLEPIRTVYYVSKLMCFSNETYRKKMNIVNSYIKHRLKRMIF